MMLSLLQDMAKGEALLKNIYEHVRLGKGWNRTMLAVVYDDAGGFFDQAIPPFEGVPADEAPCSKVNQGCPHKFDYKRLGLRSAGLLISPWVAKNDVFQEPKQGPTPTSQFELTSVPATAHKLFNLDAFLTKRDAWAGTFDELLTLDQPRADCPLTLPPVPAPHEETDNGNEAKHNCCEKGEPSRRQLRNLVTFSRETNTPVPDLGTMSYDEARRLINSRFSEWKQAQEANPSYNYHQEL